ncbi:MAG: monovalent cation/H+ antiporter complex subunit F [Desulfovibrionales bacterium]
METFYLFAALFLVVNILAGLFRIFMGPTPADRMLTAQLFGTTGAAVFLLLAEALQNPAIRDVGLTLVVLSVLAMVAFVRRLTPNTRGSGE